MIARRACDVHLAMVEVGWSPAHEDREISITRLADLTNALLRSRGEILEYSPGEIGWKLRNLGFRHRNGHGMVLQFSRENRILIHRLNAISSSIALPAVDILTYSAAGTGGWIGIISSPFHRTFG
jgi:hypothetical protein